MHTAFRRAAVAALLAAAACGDDQPTIPAAVPAADADAPARGTASARWSGVARDLMVKYRPNNPAAFRAFAYLGMAQYDAARVAEGRDRGRDSHFVPGAVAAASAAVLAYAFPAEAAALDSIVRVDGQILASTRGSARDADSSFADGVEVGRDVGARVVARARDDRFTATYTGTVPVGPGYWGGGVTPSTPPLMPGLGQMRPFVLASGSQLRPPPPPAFGSATFQAGLDEVRRIARTRTAEQTRVAQAWALPGGTVLPVGYWNLVALDLATRHHLGERQTAHVLAVVHAAMMDATIATHDAKYTYWYVRPSQADTTIGLAIGLPSHPSYPSNHTAASVAAATVLGAFFPADAARVDALAAEAGLSRIYGGLHYRFDVEAGAALGRGVAHEALVQARVGGDAAGASRGAP